MKISAKIVKSLTVGILALFMSGFCFGSTASTTYNNMLTSHSTPSTSKELTTYVTEWSGYQGYPFAGSHPNTYHDNTIVANQDMVEKAKQSDVLAFAFFQVWNSKYQSYNISSPAAWDGLLHFDDLWANLPSNQAPEYNTWKSFCGTLAAGSCAAVQLNGVTKKYQMFDYTSDDVGQMSNFSAFVNLQTNAIKVLAIGGANTLDNGSVSTHSFAAIFANQSTFVNSLAAWLNQLKAIAPTSKFGVDYDFEPPIDSNGSQIPPNADTTEDYQNLFDLVKATREKLGADYYISVTITANEDYLDVINKSEPGGWFKAIAPYVDHVNIMTYDLHGPWSISSDPGAVSHTMLRNPSIMQKNYTINYGVEDVIDKVLSFGMPADKLQAGIASYGRGFAGVVTGSNGNYPGFDKPWTGPSNFDAKYTNQAGFLPYKSVAAIVKDLGYTIYNVPSDDGSQTLAAYIYSPTAGQLVGYESPEEVQSLCKYLQQKQLAGAILWSMDTDANYDGSEGPSLITTFKNSCK